MEDPRLAAVREMESPHRASPHGLSVQTPPPPAPHNDSIFDSDAPPSPSTYSSMTSPQSDFGSPPALNNSGFQTPTNSYRNPNAFDENSRDAENKFSMSAKQTKLLKRLNDLMKNFKHLKHRVKTMQTTNGQGITPDKELFETYRKQKEEEIEQMEKMHAEELQACKAQNKEHMSLQKASLEAEAAARDAEAAARLAKQRDVFEKRLAAQKQEHDARIASIQAQHAHDLEERIAAAVRRARAEKEAELLEAEFEVREEMRQAALTESQRKKKEAEEARKLKQAERRKSVELGINRELGEYPEELLSMLQMSPTAAASRGSSADAEAAESPSPAVL